MNSSKLVKTFTKKEIENKITFRSNRFFFRENDSAREDEVMQYLQDIISQKKDGLVDSYEIFRKAIFYFDDELKCLGMISPIPLRIKIETISKEIQHTVMRGRVFSSLIKNAKNDINELLRSSDDLPRILQAEFDAKKILEILLAKAGIEYTLIARSSNLQPTSSSATETITTDTHTTDSIQPSNLIAPAPDQAQFIFDTLRLTDINDDEDLNYCKDAILNWFNDSFPSGIKSIQDVALLMPEKLDSNLLQKLQQILYRYQHQSQQLTQDSNLYVNYLKILINAVRSKLNSSDQNTIPSSVIVSDSADLSNTTKITELKSNGFVTQDVHTFFNQNADKTNISKRSSDVIDLSPGLLNPLNASAQLNEFTQRQKKSKKQ